MRASPRLRAYLRRFRRPAPPPAPRQPLPDNSYRRFFTPQPRLEDLTRPRQPDPDPPKP